MVAILEVETFRGQSRWSTLNDKAHEYASMDSSRESAQGFMSYPNVSWAQTVLFFANKLAFPAALAVLLQVSIGSRAHAVAANEPPPGVFTEDSLGAQISSEYFTTNANYEPSRGTVTGLVNGSSLTEIETKLRGRYTLSKQLSFFVGTAYTSTQVVDQSYGPSNTKNNGQFTSGLAGVDYMWNTHFVQLVPELIFSLPIDQTSSTQLNPMTNDGVTYVKLGLFAIKPYRRFRLGAYLGTLYPIDALAKRLNYEATIDWRAYKAITLGAGLDGYETLVSDTDTLVDRQTSDVRANAGSERFYAFNPSLLEARGWIGVRPNRSFWVRLGYGRTLTGLHTAVGQSVILSLIYNSDHVEATPAEVGKRRLDPQEAAKVFEPDVESTDQSVFEPEDIEIQNTTRGKESLDSTEKLLDKKPKEK